MYRLNSTSPSKVMSCKRSSVNQVYRLNSTSPSLLLRRSRHGPNQVYRLNSTSSEKTHFQRTFGNNVARKEENARAGFICNPALAGIPPGKTLKNALEKAKTDDPFIRARFSILFYLTLFLASNILTVKCDRAASAYLKSAR